MKLRQANKCSFVCGLILRASAVACVAHLMIANSFLQSSSVAFSDPHVSAESAEIENSNSDYTFGGADFVDTFVNSEDQKAFIKAKRSRERRANARQEMRLKRGEQPKSFFFPLQNSK